MLLVDEILSIEAVGDEFLLEDFCCVPYAFSNELRTEALDSALSIAARTMEDEELLIETCPSSYVVRILYHLLVEVVDTVVHYVETMPGMGMESNLNFLIWEGWLKRK